MSSSQIGLLTVPALPRCALCHSAGLNKTCPRCTTSRRRFYTPPPPPGPDALDAIDAIAARQAQQAAHAARLERWTALGRPVRVALIGCSKSKARHPAPAAQLYTGTLFRASLRYAHRTFAPDDVLILSARHHLVPPETVLEPYDYTLSKLGKRERASWATRVASALQLRFGTLPCEALFLAGASYELPWALLPRWTVSKPLARTPGFQRRISFLNEQP
ncbi:DUF6884 domain-containing protein [Corallococcus sp. AB038B]|uniref:DUF6884 domain-containing protein n=1 Tax=Corallococcus sp. AB038B TaxID=2316718 RepID=UPI000EE09A30|nr:DUF6884 domain-containing protein [Corallococcus sp. AB038B]RKH92965.1 hypothetical protein D7Y04_41830 [Corallococcus sp. AB038B]